MVIVVDDEGMRNDMKESLDHASIACGAPASKRERLFAALQRLQDVPACSSGLEMYRNLCQALNHVEDNALGESSWLPPRTFIGARSSERLYPTYPESMLRVSGAPGITALWHETEVVFISRFGAMEVEEKNGRDLELIVSEGGATRLFSRLDAYGDGVWHPKNRS
jgi:hypothetical protein